MRKRQAGRARIAVGTAPIHGPVGDAGASGGVPLLDEGGEMVADLGVAGGGHGAVGGCPGGAEITPQVVVLGWGEDRSGVGDVAGVGGGDVVGGVVVQQCGWAQRTGGGHESPHASARPSRVVAWWRWAARIGWTPACATGAMIRASGASWASHCGGDTGDAAGGDDPVIGCGVGVSSRTARPRPGSRGPGPTGATRARRRQPPS